MINEMRSVDEEFVPTLRFLVYDITDNIDGKISSDADRYARKCCILALLHS